MASATRRRITVTLEAKPHASALRAMASAAATDESTQVASAQPRESASRASAPVPAYRSRTRPPSKNWPRTLKMAARTLSLVGRVPSPAGAASRRPRADPATMRTAQPPAAWGAQRFSCACPWTWTSS